MKRNKVTSSNLKTVGYDKANKVLEIEFKNGRVYHYYSVPEEVYQEMINSESLGKYFLANIKEKYNYQQGEFNG